MAALSAQQACVEAPSGLAAFLRRHDGESIVVCGCGPSLKELAEPQRFTTIGVNDVGRLFDPTYLLVVNPRSQFSGDRFGHVERSKAQALFTQLDLGPVMPPVVRFKLGRYGGTDAGNGSTLHYTQNSPYVAACLAAWMGARRIGLIGVDFTDHHFFADSGRHPLAGRLHEIDAQYGRLAQVLRQRGIELVNLSAVSRLNALPRMCIDVSGEWQALASTLQTPEPTPRSISMKVAIEKRSQGIVSDLLETLAATVVGLGHTVSREPRRTASDPRVLSIVWNGRGHMGRGPTLFCEHGWLPRADYQVSAQGINAGSHAAPFVWDGRSLEPEQLGALAAHMERIKAASHSGHYRYMQVAGEVPEQLAPQFLLVPLQIESDTNIVRHAPGPLRTMQGLIDHVSRLEPPWPVLFKQHPADARGANAHLRLRVRRPQDAVWPHARANVHQMLKSGACRGILTINSNVAHDGLLWDVPAIVLGRNIWPSGGVGRTPFLTAIPRDWSQLAESAAAADAVDCRRAYAHFLMKQQWTLDDARDPRRVQALLEFAVREHALRAPLARPVPSLVTERRVVPPRATAVAPRPVLNVVAEDRGWLFETWKRALAAEPVTGFEVRASARPLRQAAAWLFLRASEASTTPDPHRTVVQLHDLNDDRAYAVGGARVGVARCMALSLTHPGQQALVEAQGIALAQRRWLLQPVGWQNGALSEAALPALPTVAWVGRPARCGGLEVSGLPVFAQAARHWAGLANVVLVGERMEPWANELRRAGVACRVLNLSACPPERATEWLGRFDLVVLTSTADAGPWPIFDALHAGVPVVALPVGWATTLLTDGQAGRLVEDAAALAAAVPAMLAEREAWRTRRATVRARVAGFGFDAWLRTNLQLAAELARPAVHHAA